MPFRCGRSSLNWMAPLANSLASLRNSAMSKSAGWRVGTLGDIAHVNPESLSALADRAWRFRYIDLSSAKRGQIDWAGTSELTLAQAPSRARRLVAPQDVLFGTVRPV